MRIVNKQITFFLNVKHLFFPKTFQKVLENKMTVTHVCLACFVTYVKIFTFNYIHLIVLEFSLQYGVHASLECNTGLQLMTYLCSPFSSLPAKNNYLRDHLKLCTCMYLYAHTHTHTYSNIILQIEKIIDSYNTIDILYDSKFIRLVAKSHLVIGL